MIITSGREIKKAENDDDFEWNEIKKGKMYILRCERASDER